MATAQEVTKHFTRHRYPGLAEVLTHLEATGHIADEYPWAEGQAVSFLELQLYNMRHVQEHAAQLNLFLAQSAIPAVPDWIPRAKDEPGSQ